ncbi:MAG: response regulator [Acidobacteriaceae bacterium]|jgi:CheY-like chemotaxis protein|nr:response regulator [Acidobacteriaceae bacterium]
MAKATILLVDDDEPLRYMLACVLQEHGYDVTTAASVPEALKLISAGSYDVLLSDLHMPGKGDGLTVVSAMRHANPKAVTMLLSAFPEMDAAAQAILLQADQILVKPMNIPALIEAIQQRLASGPAPSRSIESVATILDYSAESTIDAWYERVKKDKKLTAVSMSREQRVGHLPRIITELVRRLRSFKPLGSRELVSVASEEHGRFRRRQGYSAGMLVEESRMLQVSIFETLQKNLAGIDFSILLEEVMTIADEVDSQLSQAMDSYIEEAFLEGKPA